MNWICALLLRTSCVLFGLWTCCGKILKEQLQQLYDEINNDETIDKQNDILNLFQKEEIRFECKLFKIFCHTNSHRVFYEAETPGSIHLWVKKQIDNKRWHSEQQHGVVIRVIENNHVSLLSIFFFFFFFYFMAFCPYCFSFHYLALSEMFIYNVLTNFLTFLPSPHANSLNLYVTLSL